MNLKILSRENIQKLRNNDDSTWRLVHDELRAGMKPTLIKRWNNSISAAGIASSLYGNDYHAILRDVEDIFENTMMTFNSTLVNDRFEWRSEKETLGFLYFLSKIETSRLLRDKIESLKILSLYDFFQSPDTSGTANRVLNRSSVESNYDRTEIFAKIEAILKELSPRQAYVFRLFHFHGYSHGQIAYELSIKPTTSRNILFKATRYIRIRLEEMNIK